MSANNKQHLTECSDTNSSGQKKVVLLSPKDVAERLGVCDRTAKRIMMELPHVLVSMEMYCNKKRVRITEETFENYARGIIARRRLRRAE